MDDEQARLALAAWRQDRADDPALAAQALAAREAVAARDTGIDQAEIVEDIPNTLEQHVQQLRQHQQAAPYFNEGWEVRLVDLRRVGSLQQTVQAEQAVERVANIDPDDIGAVAAVALPDRQESQQLPIQFDESKQTWVVSAANPNLKIVGHFGGEVEGHQGFGFVVAVMASFLQVARHHGRYVLRDGYHRAYGLLSRDINKVPAFVRDFGVGELGLGAGLFGTDIYLGERPPRLSDFLDDTVAADVQIPIAQKMLVVQGIELTTLV